MGVLHCQIWPDKIMHCGLIIIMDFGIFVLLAGGSGLINESQQEELFGNHLPVLGRNDGMFKVVLVLDHELVVMTA